VKAIAMTPSFFNDFIYTPNFGVKKLTGRVIGKDWATPIGNKMSIALSNLACLLAEG
jgi:hypothetical protein